MSSIFLPKNFAIYNIKISKKTELKSNTTNNYFYYYFFIIKFVGERNYFLNNLKYFIIFGVDGDCKEMHSSNKCLPYLIFFHLVILGTDTKE